MIHDLKVEEKRVEDFPLPRFWQWDKGFQASVLRGFSIGNGLPSVKFHILRACFATQLISTEVPATVVMKIAGWRDMKTMQRYIRLAGIDEAGATEVLRFIPTEEAVMERVVSLFRHGKEADIEWRGEDWLGALTEKSATLDELVYDIRGLSSIRLWYL